MVKVSTMSSSSSTIRMVPLLTGFLPRRRERQIDRERGALAQIALHLHAAAVRLDQASDDVEAEAQASIVAQRDRPLVGLEDLIQLIRGNPLALIAHDQASARLRAAHVHMDRPVAP